MANLSSAWFDPFVLASASMHLPSPVAAITVLMPRAL
jgi:hypothetical protein